MKGMLDRGRLLQCFRDLGICEGTQLMVHASLSSLGVVDGGAGGLVGAMLEAVGSDGTVLMPAFRDSIRSDAYSLKACEDCPGREFCPSTEPGTTGAVGEAVRLYRGALRSCHPTHSWVAVGRRGRELLGRHRLSPTPCGKGSPFFPLMELDGLVLLLGVGIDSFTNFHAIEDALGLPYVSAYDGLRRHATYTTSGRRIQYNYPLLLEAGLNECGILRYGRVGAAIVISMRAREIGSFLWQVVADDPWCLALRPRGRVYHPFEDACLKVARMVRTWQSDPSPNAWERLLAQSERDIQPPVFEPCAEPRTDCPAHRGFLGNYHRCAANDPPPWEKFDGYPPRNLGVATCRQCSWPRLVPTRALPALQNTSASPAL